MEVGAKVSSKVETDLWLVEEEGTPTW